MGRKRITIIIIFLTVIALLGVLLWLLPRNETHRILVIHSFSEDHPLYSDYNKKIVSQFKQNKINADIRVLYLDCERYSEKPEIEHLNRLINKSIQQNWTPELIIVTGDQATYSLLRSEHPISKKLPIVFGGVEYPNDKLIRKFSNVTGFVDKIDVMRNLDFIRRIMGNSVAIYTPVDFSYLGKKVNEDVKEQLKGQHVSGRYTTPGLKADEIRRMNVRNGYIIYDNFKIIDQEKHKSEINKLIPQIRVFSNHFNKSQDGESYWMTNLQYDGISHLVYKYDKFTELLLGISPNPIFTAENKVFGYTDNVVGGYITTMYMEVDDEVDMASRILKGENISKLPISQSSKMYAVNWDAIKKYKINPGRLPQSCVIINRPLREQYPLAWTLSIIGTAILFVFLIALYIFEVKKRHNMNILIRQQHNMLKSSLFAAKAFAWKYKDGFFTIDDSFWESLGKEPQKISIAQLQEMILPEHRKSLAEIREMMIDKKNGDNIQMQISFNGKDYSWWESRFFISENRKEKNAYYGLSFNIDQTKRREHELEELRRLAEKAEMKQSFLENINHEIRTPLNSITGFSHILASDYNLSDEERERYLELVDNNNEKLIQIIDNILLISQLESGEIKMNFEVINLKEIVDSIYDDMKSQTGSKNLDFIKEEDAECSILGDRKYMTMVIRHLVGNAIKFTTSGYVKFGYQRDSTNKMVEIFVEDTGRGISGDEKKMIFQHFYKEDRFDEGLGLGLNIINLIVVKHNSKLNLVSEKNSGSRFSFSIPFTKS